MQIFVNSDLRVFSGGNYPSPVPAIFNGLPYPTWRGIPNFCFRQNDPKGCSLAYLDDCGYFLFLIFGAAGKILNGGGNNEG